MLCGLVTPTWEDVAPETHYVKVVAQFIMTC